MKKKNKDNGEKSWMNWDTYQKIHKDMEDNWPAWKKQVYNEMFASTLKVKQFVVD